MGWTNNFKSIKKFKNNNTAGGIKNGFETKTSK